MHGSISLQTHDAGAGPHGGNGAARAGDHLTVLDASNLHPHHDIGGTGDSDRITAPPCGFNASAHACETIDAT